MEMLSFSLNNFYVFFFLGGGGAGGKIGVHRKIYTRKLDFLPLPN